MYLGPSPVVSIILSRCRASSVLPSKGDRPSERQLAAIKTVAFQAVGDLKTDAKEILI